MNNDPMAYLHRMGMPKHVSKGAERGAKGVIHNPAFPNRNDPVTSPNDRKLPTTKKAIGVSGSTRGLGSLGSKPESGMGKAKSAKIEGNESAQYEKMEKMSLKGTKTSALRAGRTPKGAISPMGKNTKKGQKA